MAGRAARSLGLLAALVLVAGCGSTVQYSGTASVTTGGDTGLGAPVAPGQSGTGGGASPAVPGQGGTAQAGTTGSTAPGSGPVPVGGVPTAVPLPGGGPETGLGFTRDTIKIGYATADDYNAFAGSLGINGVTASGDPKVQMQAVVNDINKRGGLLGRKIVLVPHDYNTAQTVNDPASANQAACADWTEDNHVFAVVLAPIIEDTLLSCLAKARTPLVNAGGLDFPNPYDEVFRKYPLFFDVAQMSGELHDRIAIDRLAARGFFTPWDTFNGKPGTAAANPVKVGLLEYDDHPGALQLASELRQLKRHGITVASNDIVKCPRPVSGTISCQQSAVLRMASNNVTHIFGAGIIFIPQAESQHYRPRYFFRVEPRVIAENSPAAQMAGAMGESNLPVMDVEAEDHPGDPSPASAYCKNVMRKAGQAGSDPTTLWTQFGMCDALYALEGAVRLAGVLGPDALRAGFERLGTSVPSALTWGSTFGPTLHASSVVLRDIGWDAARSRFVYVDKVNRT